MSENLTSPYALRALPGWLLLDCGMQLGEGPLSESPVSHAGEVRESCGILRDGRGTALEAALAWGFLSLPVTVEVNISRCLLRRLQFPPSLVVAQVWLTWCRS